MGGGARRYGWSGFTNTQEYLKSLPSTPALFAKRAGYVRDGAAQVADKAAAGQEMAKVGGPSAGMLQRQETRQHRDPGAVCHEGSSV